MIGSAAEADFQANLASEFERKYFWWEPVGSQPRSDARIFAQAMELASFAEIRRIERTLGHERLVALMRRAEPGWFSEKSWEFWRGRLSAAAGQALPDQPPQRTVDAPKL